MTLLKSSLFLLLSIFFIGCTNSPDKTVEEMYDALKKGNLSKLINNTTDKMSGAFAGRALKECSVDKKSYTDDLKLVEDCMLELYSDLSVKSIKLVKEDATSALVEAVVQNNKIESKAKIALIKVDGKWKVAGTE